MSQLSFLDQANNLENGLEKFSETWPKSGLMQNGLAYKHQTWALHTNEIESGLWATPTTMDHLNCESQKMKEEIKEGRRKRSSNLRDQVMWPTPTVGCVEGGEQSDRVERTKNGGYILRKKNKPHMTYGAKLSDAILFEEKQKMWPTPTANPATASQSVESTIKLTKSRDRKQGSLIEKVVERQMYPTPIASDGSKCPTGSLAKTMEAGHPYMNKNGTPIAHKKHLFPTPTARDHKGQSGKGRQERKGHPADTLPNAVMMYPTPTASDHKGSGKNDTQWGRLDYAIEKPEGKRMCGHLNPLFVTWLMGYPLNWLIEYEENSMITESLTEIEKCLNLAPGFLTELQN
tara:strand:- start:92 stop:1129 length:1038 start_codon:yes stop_codon:yes gene_type:complete